VQARVEVNKGQILALLGREGFYGATQAGHPIQLFVRASNQEEARMNVRYRVELSQTERAELTALLSGGKHAARKLKRAQILLAADVGASDEVIAANVGVGESTVYRTKRRFVLGNLEAALGEEPRPNASRKLSGKDEALLIATSSWTICRRTRSARSTKPFPLVKRAACCTGWSSTLSQARQLAQHG